ncbi:hypothetical protein SAMN04488563_6780 [Jiangella alkaliphila]|uniref:Uncharacterized protein n=2 Tax=Jiangella alkaliphila TaxID=419479 RepID=A0A1H2LX44_9ACTN|nr:hypothetical protein SAMN04488563_6780 [Jiangella alkaliphila]
MGRMPDKVPNPYLAAVRANRGDAEPAATGLRGDLDAAVTAMDNGAWQSSVADTFYTELTGHKTTLTNAADGALGGFDDIIASQPEEVEPNSWQTHWRNL